MLCVFDAPGQPFVILGGPSTFCAPGELVASNKVKGPVGNFGPQVGVTWNVHEWEVTN